MGKCKVDNCNRDTHARGLCNTHYVRLWRTGSRAEVRKKREYPSREIVFHQSYEVDEVTGCWNWIKFKNHKGYGSFQGGEKLTRAHRYAWQLYFGDPTGMCVCHRCDNPGCVNPQHLFLGTQQENMDDCSRKGRKARGSKIPRTILNEELVKEIRASKETDRALAKKYNTCFSNINEIRNFKRWKWVQDGDSRI